MEGQCTCFSMRDLAPSGSVSKNCTIPTQVLKPGVDWLLINTILIISKYWWQMFLLEETILCDWLVPGLHPNYGHFTGSLRMLTGSFSTNHSEFHNWSVCIAILRRYFSILYCMYVLYILNRTVCIVYSQSRILSIPKFLVKSIYECTIIRVWVKIEDAGNRRYRTGGTMSITMYNAQAVWSF
jgi:hypothetical protein